MTALRALRAGIATSLALASVAGAQVSSAPQRRLCQPPDVRLDATTCKGYNAIVDSAKIAKLPTMLLEDKALQGVFSESDGATILAAVRKLFKELRDARQSMSAASTDGELKAAAAALDAGATTRDLAQFRAAPRGKRSLEVALTVFTELSVQIPMTADVNDIYYMLKVNVSDAYLQSVEAKVQAAVKQGADSSTVEILANQLARAPVIIHR